MTGHAGLQALAIFLWLLVVSLLGYAILRSLNAPEGTNGDVIALAGLAGLGAAAWLAWRSVQLQIRAARDEADRNRRTQLAAVADSVAGDLLAAANFAKAYQPPGPVIAWLGALSQSSIGSIMEVNSILGTCLVGHAVDMDSFRRTAEAASSTVIREGAGALILPRFRQEWLRFAFRSAVLAQAHMQASSALRADRPVTLPLVAAAELEELMREFEPDPEAMQFASILCETAQIDNLRAT